MELAERNPSLGGRELLREIIERGSPPALHEPPLPRDLVAALRPKSLDDADYRTSAEQAAQLQRESPALRDLYERGAVVKGATLIVPTEAHELSEDRAQPFLTTFAYAQQKLTDPQQAKEFYELARTISGTTADSRTELTVFKIYYDRLARDEQGRRLEKQDAEGQRNAVTRTLTEMRELAREMASLETRESVEIEPVPEREFAPGVSAVNVAARILDLRVESLRWPAELSGETKARLLTKTLPELDYRLERGVPRIELFRAIDRSMARPDGEVSQEQRTEISGFLKQYLDERLRYPETRALHTSPAFRQAREAFLLAKTPAGVSRAAADFYRTNRERAEAQRLHLAEPAQHPPPAIKPLDARERNLLFYGRAPEHYTSEMRELRIAYGLTQTERAERVAQLRAGSLAASPPLQQLLDELATRRTVKAVNHFQASLINEQVAQPNRLNLYLLEQRLPPYERAYLFEQTQQRKQELQIQMVRPLAAVREAPPTRAVGEPPRGSESFREYLAHLGRIERQLLNAALAERETAQTRQELLTITAARERLPEPIAQQIRFQASQLAWAALLPRADLERDPSPAAARVSATLTLLQEELQPRARLAQAARTEAQASALERDSSSQSVVATARLAALEQYVSETREAFYQGFELLNQQRLAWEQERREAPPSRGVEIARSSEHPPKPDSARSVVSEPTQLWHFDRLHDVLVFGRPGNDSAHTREAVHSIQIAHELER